MNWRVFASLILFLLAGGLAVTAWAIPAIYNERSKPFLAAFANAEAKYKLPQGLLSRVAYQESRFDANAVSPVGAVGLMQFMPATAADFGIDPTDPFQSIDAAGKYLAQLYRQFGTWSAAIAAYNFGPGNVQKNISKYGALNIAALPPETRNYLSIATDIGVA